MHSLLRKFVLFNILLFVISAWMVGQENSYKPLAETEQFKSNLNRINEGTITLLSDFRQVKHLDILLEDIVTTGKFYYKKENMLRWEYTDPFRYIIIFRESEIYIRDEEHESHFDTESNQVFKQISRLMTSIVRGKIMEEDEDFSSTFLESPEDYLVLLQPQSEQYKQFFHQIEIHFKKENYSVIMLKLVEKSGDFTLIEFHNEKRNENIPDSVFDPV